MLQRSVLPCLAPYLQPLFTGLKSVIHGTIQTFQLGIGRPQHIASVLQPVPQAFPIHLAHWYYIQYPSIKSLRSTIVERSFYGASVFAERRSRTVSVLLRLSSVLFRFHSVLLANQRDPCEVSVNASFGSEDDLQLLQMVAEGSRYESASFCVAARACSDPESRFIKQRAEQ